MEFRPVHAVRYAEIHVDPHRAAGSSVAQQEDMRAILSLVAITVLSVAVVSAQEGRQRSSSQGAEQAGSGPARSAGWPRHAQAVLRILDHGRRPRRNARDHAPRARRLSAPRHRAGTRRAHRRRPRHHARRRMKRRAAPGSGRNPETRNRRGRFNRRSGSAPWCVPRRIGPRPSAGLESTIHNRERRYHDPSPDRARRSLSSIRIRTITDPRGRSTTTITTTRATGIRTATARSVSATSTTTHTSGRRAWYYNGYAYGYGHGYPAGELRLQVRPPHAEVYVDGYFAGLVDDFDGVLQGLRLEEGPVSGSRSPLPATCRSSSTFAFSRDGRSITGQTCYPTDHEQAPQIARFAGACHRSTSER